MGEMLEEGKGDGGCMMFIDEIDGVGGDGG